MIDLHEEGKRDIVPGTPRLTPKNQAWCPRSPNELTPLATNLNRLGEQHAMCRVQIRDDIAVDLHGLSSQISSVLHSNPELGKEFKILFSRVLKDPPMAIACARRLLEVLVAKGLARLSKLGLQNTKKLPCLEKMIDTFTATQPYSKELASICHAVRLEGNRVLHYHPDGPVSPKMSPSQLVDCLRRVSEVAEMTTTGNTTIYTSRRNRDVSMSQGLCYNSLVESKRLS